MTKALVPLAQGCEEMEAVIILDTLRRAGWEVAGVGLTAGDIVASRGVTLVPDATWEEIDPSQFDLLVLPGGAGGTQNLSTDPRVLEAVRTFYSQGKIVAAVCAGPLVLQSAGVLEGHQVTCHPSAAEELTMTKRRSERVVVDGQVITSQGPGSTFEFALKIIEQVDGPEKAASIGKAMVVPPS